MLKRDIDIPLAYIHLVGKILPACHGLLGQNRAIRSAEDLADGKVRKSERSADTAPLKNQQHPQSNQTQLGSVALVTSMSGAVIGGGEGCEVKTRRGTRRLAFSSKPREMGLFSIYPAGTTGVEGIT